MLESPTFGGPYGLIGHPTAHSLSPVMHNSAFLHVGLPYRYWLYDVPPSELKQAVELMKDNDIQGFNVTIPHKQAVMYYLDEIHDDARMIGAVNTVCRQGDRWIGYNTDAPGLLDTLQLDGEFDPAGRQVTILGAGGAARAAALALAKAGAKEIALFNRSLERAEQLVRNVQQHVRGCRAEALPWNLELMEKKLKHTDLLVNTTPIGMEPKVQESPIADAAWIQPHTVVFDMVYKPRLTLLLQQAQAQGAKIVDGLGLLLHQGARAFELWTLQPAPIEVMRSALYDAIDYSS